MGLWRKLRYLVPSVRRAEERDMQEELETLAQLAGPGELGNLTLAAERRREVWGWTWLERLGQDIRYAFRAMRKSPAFAATAVVSLALGIGANTAIFSLIDALMLRWLPVRDPHELILVRFQTAGGSAFAESFSYPIARTFAEQKDIFASATGFSGASFDVDHAGSVSRVPGAWVTGGYYETLGLIPVAGRLLTRDDDEPGVPLMAVISYGYWERQFGRDAAAIGQTLRLNGVSVTIAGISPPGFVGATVGILADITVPVAALPRITPEAAPLLGAGNFWLRVLARPTAGISTQQAHARLAAVWPQLSERVIRPDWPAARRKEFTNAVFEFASGGTGWTYLRQMYQKPLLVLMAMVALVLLIACANVANLLLARATARQREIAIRLAIGAGRGRIVRQLLTESTLLSLIGAALGIELAWFSGRILLSTISAGPAPVMFDLTPNWHVLGFTSLVAIGTGLLFGVAPALQTTAAGTSPVLKQDDARMSRSRSRLLSVLLTAQIALSLLLLVGAGLFVRTLQNLQHLDPGFRREGVLLINFDGRRTRITGELLTDVMRAPGIVSASISTHTPLSGSTWSEPAVPTGQTLPERDNAYFIGAGPRFFETLQTQLVAGREFDERDRGKSPSVAVVNEAFARRHFPGHNPVGRHLSARVMGRAGDLEIVGIVKNANLAGLRAAPPPTVYVPYAQLTGDFPTTLVFRASGSMAQAAESIRSKLQRQFPNTRVETRALTDQMNAAMVRERMMATLAGAFGVLALILACVGLYGLLAYNVARRTTEMGIRMALGAQRHTVIMMVVKDAVRLVTFGVLIGVPMTWIASRWVQSMLFGLTPTDPTTVTGAALLLTLAALLAAYVPASRASRLEPVTALRHE
jgi:predicted permease